MTELLYIGVGFVTLFSGMTAVIAFTNQIITNKINRLFKNQEEITEKRLKKLDERLITTEKNLFRTNIFEFTRRIRNGENPDLNEFYNILHDAKLYKNIGGNMYVDEEIRLIKESLRKTHGKEVHNV